MCGIAGVYSPDPRAGQQIQYDLLKRMADTLVHRGPDEEGFHLDNGIGLAFRRLAIVDIKHGQQPLKSADHSVHAVVNGEIYNFKELRTTLESKGIVLNSASDVEVVPHLYSLYGEDFVSHLKGQFAIALYDQKRHTLLLARDGVGIAPLFWTEQNGSIRFASEIRALLCTPDVRREVNLKALDQLLTFPGTASPETFFSGIFSVKPGHILTFSPKGKSERCFWDLVYPRADESVEYPKDMSSAISELDKRLNQAVVRRLQGDLPVAMYISGGLDSSLVAAMVTEHSQGVIRDSFSITFDNKNIDESHYQQLMAKHLGTRHHTMEVRPEHIAKHLRDIVNRAEGPLKESYNVCSLLLSGLVKAEGIKSVVSGEGADELFAGYVGYRLNPSAAEDAFDLEEMLERQMRERIWGEPALFYEKNYQQHYDTKAYLYSEAVRARLPEFDCLASPLIDTTKLKGRHPTHQRSYIDFKLRMADHLLSDHGDRVAFANSVEARYPFLDDDVIDYVRGIPPQWLLHNAEEKYLLKRLAERYLPSPIIERQKFSFVAPSSAYLLKKQQELVGDMLSPERIRRQGVFDPDTVEHLRQSYLQPDHQLNQTFEDDFLMCVLTFGIWMDEFQISDLNA